MCIRDSLLTEIEFIKNTEKSLNFFHIDSLLNWFSERENLFKRITRYFHMGIFGQLVIHFAVCAVVTTSFMFGIIESWKFRLYISCAIIDMIFIAYVSAKTFYAGVRINSNFKNMVASLLEMKKVLKEITIAHTLNKSELDRADGSAMLLLGHVNRINYVDSFQIAHQKMNEVRMNPERKPIDEAAYLSEVEATLNLIIEKIVFDKDNRCIKLFGIFPITSAMLKTTALGVISLAIANFHKRFGSALQYFLQPIHTCILPCV
eukprot:TRINITY_DN4300_c0_g1_i1.p1 TRINITY_DN4300_c0_g1~~TRINITY_DN4300_c0_g1_i1.p1  ORF type:complete len:282 (+),score=59.80 TRINITY_DN4300_c0_g1_i1:61-846(+)